MCWRCPTPSVKENSPRAENQKVDNKSEFFGNKTLISVEKISSVITTEKNEFKDSYEDVHKFVKNEFKILNDNIGSIFVIEASLKGAFF